DEELAYVAQWLNIAETVTSNDSTASQHSRISRSASGLTRKKAHCIESRHEDDAMPSQMSERSDLAEQIARCRRLANAITDQATVQLLLAMAIEYELRLDRISQ